MTGQGEGLSFDSSAQEMLKNVCKDIQGQKKRLGGDFAVATVVFSKKSRDLCRLDNEFAFMYTYIVINILLFVVQEVVSGNCLYLIDNDRRVSEETPCSKTWGKT